MARLLQAFALLLVLSALPACDETDAVSVRIHLAPDFSGTVTTSALALPSSESLMQQASQGAEWQNRVDVVAVAGRFQKLDDLKLADLAFSAGEAGSGMRFARVTLPRGAQAKWARALVPLSVDERQRAAAALDPTGKSKNVGSMIKIEIELPNAVVGNGLIGKTRGTKTQSEGSVATLTVPLDSALNGEEELVWHLTWQK